MNAKVYLLSTVWSTLNAFKRNAYRWGVLKRTRFPSRVISVGNLQAGGAGKTPVVAFIAAEAIKKNKRVCILTRGYKSAFERKGGLIEPLQIRPPVSVCGDEPALLHARVPEAWIGIGADREKSFERVCKRMGGLPDLVILDDGFQKVEIHRDVNIALMTSHRPNETYFREFLGASRFADLRVWSKGFERPSDTNVRIRFEIPINPTPESRFLLLTSIADADDLLLSLKSHGYGVERELRLGDHEIPTREHYQSCFEQIRARSLQLIMTGKDFVKYQDVFMDRGRLEDGVPVPVVIEPEVKILEGADHWNRLLWV